MTAQLSPAQLALFDLLVGAPLLIGSALTFLPLLAMMWGL